jgi:hypothetical protein
VTVLAIITALRLIPYAIVFVIAFRKGFKWLALTMAYLFLVLIINYFFEPSAEWRGFLSSGFAVLILLHVLDLKARKASK